MNQRTDNPWTLDRIQQLRKDGVEESLGLDYKGRGALNRSDSKIQTELTKDVSAFADSSGGVIIYGILEDPANNHPPGELDPIPRAADIIRMARIHYSYHPTES